MDGFGDLGNVTMQGAQGALIVLAIVQAAKTFGLPEARAPQAAIVAGFAVACLKVLEGFFPEVVKPIESVLVMGLALAYMASGVYSHALAGKSVAAAPEDVGATKPLTGD